MKTVYIERSTGTSRNGNWAETLDLEGVERIVVGTGPGSFAGIRAALAFAQGYAIGSGCEVLGLPSPCALAADYYAPCGRDKRVPPSVSADATSASLPIASADATSASLPLASADATSASLPLASADATSASLPPLAVVGDARQGKFWIALFDGLKLVCEIFQVDRETLPLRVPLSAKVLTPDAARIDAVLKEVFEDRYLGGATPTADGLRRFAEADPSVLKPEPLPIYLNPAVRST